VPKYSGLRSEGFAVRQTLICYAASSKRYEAWLEAGQPDEAPADVPFRMPDRARKGDRYLLFVGGVDQTFVGWGKIWSNWKSGRGAWAGHDQILVIDHFFREPRDGSDIEAATGYKLPRRELVVPDEYAAVVWRTAQARRYSPVDRAVEGILTETRSRQRHPGLRLAALKRANGRCECCGVNYQRYAAGFGVRCLVVHHKNQIKDTDQPRETRISELAVLCANCHMMIHANPSKALTVKQLRSRLGR
jgi:hypothetical protein